MQTPDVELSLSILNQAPLGVATLDADGRLTWCNAALSELSGRPQEALAGADEASLLADGALSAQGVVALAGSDRLVERSEARTAAGQRIVYYRDVSDREALAHELQQHNSIDAASGLLNEQAVGRGLDPLVSRSRRYENPLSVVTMSLTNLDAVRSEHGDAAADSMLLDVSRLLRDQIRWADLIGRLDNGNFIFILPETGQSAAESLAGKISRQLREFRSEGLAQSAEGCFGVANWRKGDDARLLIKRANEALEQAVLAGQFSVVAA